MSEARQYAARNRQGSDWFSHDATSPAASNAKSSEVQPQSKPAAPETNGEPCTSDRAQMIKPTSDSNDWFRYDHADSKQGNAKPAEAPPAPVPVVAKDVEPKREVESSSAGSDAASNQQRSKAGMGNDWFSHDHPEGTASEPAYKHGATKELGENAARMRGESEHWFSHDHSEGDRAAAVAAVQANRGRSNRQATNDSMHDIFHH